MVRLYMDESVEGPIVRGLRLRGSDVVTVEEDGRGGAPDPALLDRAGELGRVAVSRDQDFLREATRRQRSGEMFAGVIYAHKQRVSLAQCIEDLELLAQVGLPDDFTDRVYFLPL